MKNTEIISATKARELTNESIENDDKCLIPIMNKIKEAIKKKQYNCYIDGYYDNCEYVCYSRAIGFGSKTPIPTCRRFHSNYEDPNLRGTYERCCDVAISGRCLIKGAKEIEQYAIDLLIEQHNKEIEIRKQLREKGYDTRHY